MNHLKICGDCYEQRAARIRRQRFWATVRGIVFLAGIIIGGAIIVSFVRQTAAAPNAVADELSTNQAGDGSNSAMLVDPPAMNAVASDIPADQPTSTLAAQPTTPSHTDDQPEQSYSADAPPSPELDDRRDEFALAINDATPRALETGEPEAWHAAGRNGYVVPSAIQAYGDRNCRNVFSSIYYGDHQTQSPPVQWCREADGDWHLSN